MKLKREPVKIEEITQEWAADRGAFDSLDELKRAEPNQNQEQKHYPFWYPDGKGRVVINIIIPEGFLNFTSPTTKKTYRDEFSGPILIRAC